jgi:hypothetical protein
MRHMEETPYQEVVFEWHKEFSEGREDVEMTNDLTIQ